MQDKNTLFAAVLFALTVVILFVLYAVLISGAVYSAMQDALRLTALALGVALPIDLLILWVAVRNDLKKILLYDFLINLFVLSLVGVAIAGPGCPSGSNGCFINSAYGLLALVVFVILAKWLLVKLLFEFTYKKSLLVVLASVICFTIILFLSVIAISWLLEIL